MTAILWAALSLAWGAVALTTGIAIGLTIHTRDQHETPTPAPWTPPQDTDPLEAAWLLPAHEPQP